MSLHVFYPQYIDLMSALDSPIGHAVRADGGLKDASEMEWTYDKEESIPFPFNSLTIPAIDDPAAFPPSKSVRIHSFFMHRKPPATLITGARCSTHTSRPSQHIRDAKEVAALATGSTTAKPSTGSKRKATVNLSPGPTRRVVNKAVVDSDDNDNGNDTEPDGYKLSLQTMKIQTTPTYRHRVSKLWLMQTTR